MDKYRQSSKIKTTDVSGTFKITLKTLFGLEQVLKEELEELGYNEVEVLNRATQITGTWRDVYFLNLHCRCVISILVEIAAFRIKHEDDLYKQAKKIDWTAYFDINKTFAIKGAVISNFFNHTQFPYLVVKDAIADVFRDQYGKRPDVDIKRPQVLFDLYINNDWVTISLNTSGLPLYQRGYREDVGEAPLNEVLAAGMLRLAKWDKQTPLIDPFCGSGTILIEAALYAAGIPSTIERQHYAFKNFYNYDEKLWQEIYGEAEQKMKATGKLPVEILGFDINSEMVLKARRNLRRFNIGRFVEIKTASFDEVKNLGFEKGVMVTNPPYGERISANIPELYSKIGDWMKTELKGFDCWMITSSEEGLKSIGLKPDAKIKLFNGSLECSYRKFSIYSGSKREKFQVKEH
ncbi:MAG: class I SAM-dependent RNA methyltransferase [Crocinitomicaceae bacterium]|nr:class I SAM-dependent RNA methyltransferase [Crocinitomicaceae bacterium]